MDLYLNISINSHDNDVIHKRCEEIAVILNRIEQLEENDSGDSQFDKEMIKLIGSHHQNCRSSKA